MSFGDDLRGMFGGNKGPTVPQMEGYPSPDSLKIPQPVMEPTPDWEDVRQYEMPVMNAVPVDVVGAVQVQDLPAKRGMWRSFHIPASTANPAPLPVEVVPGDPRIKHVWFQSDNANPGNIYLGTKEQIASLIGTGTTDAFGYFGSMMIGPFEGFEVATYAIAQTGSSINILNVRIEYWAD